MEIKVTESKAKGRNFEFLKLGDQNVFTWQRDLIGHDREDSFGVFCDKDSMFWLGKQSKEFTFDKDISTCPLEEIPEEIKNRIKMVKEWVEEQKIETSITFEL